MRRRKPVKKLASHLIFSLALLSAAACVTVNVNLPEAAVQKASDDYVREIYRPRDRARGTGPAAEPSKAPTSWNLPTVSFFTTALAAEQPSIQTQSPKASEIQKRLAARVSD